MKQLPGPGKYETIDMLGSGREFYNSKYKTQKQKSFVGSERFLNSSYFLIKIRKRLDREIIRFSIY